MRLLHFFLCFCVLGTSAFAEDIQFFRDREKALKMAEEIHKLDVATWGKEVTSLENLRTILGYDDMDVQLAMQGNKLVGYSISRTRSTIGDIGVRNSPQIRVYGFAAPKNGDPENVGIELAARIEKLTPGAHVTYFTKWPEWESPYAELAKDAAWFQGLMKDMGYVPGSPENLPSAYRSTGNRPKKTENRLITNEILRDEPYLFFGAGKGPFPKESLRTLFQYIRDHTSGDDQDPIENANFLHDAHKALSKVIEMGVFGDPKAAWEEARRIQEGGLPPPSPQERIAAVQRIRGMITPVEEREIRAAGRAGAVPATEELTPEKNPHYWLHLGYGPYSAEMLEGTIELIRLDANEIKDAEKKEKYLRDKGIALSKVIESGTFGDPKSAWEKLFGYIPSEGKDRLDAIARTLHTPIEDDSNKDSWAVHQTERELPKRTLLKSNSVRILPLNSESQAPFMVIKDEILTLRVPKSVFEKLNREGSAEKFLLEAVTALPWGYWIEYPQLARGIYFFQGRNSPPIRIASIATESGPLGKAVVFERPWERETEEAATFELKGDRDLTWDDLEKMVTQHRTVCSRVLARIKPTN